MPQTQLEVREPVLKRRMSAAEDNNLSRMDLADLRIRDGGLVGDFTTDSFALPTITSQFIGFS
jgi:hypothetical protein